METLTEATKIRSNTHYQIDGEIVGTITLNNVNNVVIEGGKLRGGYNLTGAVNGITWLDTEAYGGNIGVQVRSEGQDLRFEGCKLHDSTFAAWIRPSSGGYNSGIVFDGCTVYNTLDDGIYIYKAHGLEIINSRIERVNLNWKPPVTSQKVAAGDGMQLTLCDKIRIEGNTIDRSATGNKFCIIFAGSAGSNGTPKVPGNFIQINNNSFIQPVKTSEGGAGLYFTDLPGDLTTEFTFNTLVGEMAGIKYTCLGTFYSNGNTYQGNAIGIEVQRLDAKGISQDDEFKNCARKVSANVTIN